MWIVGVDIAPGTYRSDGTDRCLWQRLTGFGGFSDESNGWGGGGDGPRTVTIAATDAGFSSFAGCGTWSPAPTSGPQATTFGPGAWIVGVDIAPGTYRSSSDRISCGWTRLSGFDGAYFTSRIEGGFGDVRPTVVIEASDAGFASDAGCGTWTLESAVQP